MTEHAAVMFVFFFLAEYASMVLICMLTTMLFLGGYLLDFSSIMFLMEYMDSTMVMDNGMNNESFLSNPWMEGGMYGFVMGFKTSVMMFVFMWVSASFPSMRFDQLMSYCWTMLLPLMFAFIMLVPCVTYVFEMMPSNVVYS